MHTPETAIFGQRHKATDLGIHVTSDLGMTPDPAPISDHQPPTRPGDNTPRIMDDWGQESCRAWLADLRITEMGRR
jgi:hypothetical protein